MAISYIKSKKVNTDTFIILAAGIGRRMKSFDPKSLIMYGRHSVIEHQIKAIRHVSPRGDIILVSGFKSNKVIGAVSGIRIVENTDYEETGAVESLRLAINSSLESNVYIIHGDVIVNHYCLSIPNKDEPHLLVDKNNYMDKLKVGIRSEEDSAAYLTFNSKNKWGQVAYIPSEYYQYARNLVNKLDKRMSTYEYVNKLIDGGLQFKIYGSEKSFLKEIDSPGDTR